MTPDYHTLKVFGCLCYPYLRPYASNKLNSRSKPCVFIGYCGTQKGYMCLEHKSNRLYISRHVRFVEKKIPFSGLSCSTIPEARTHHAQSKYFYFISFSHPSPYKHHFYGTPLETLLLTPLLYLIPQMNPLPSSLHMTLQTHPFHLFMYKERLLLVLKSGIHKPIKRLCLTASKHPLQSTTIVDPSCYSEASTNSEWHHVMDDEINVFLCNGTWTLVPAKQNYNFIGCKWVFRTKTIADDKTERRKAHLVAKQFNQQPGIDFGETFNPVINPCTIRLVLTIALYRNWPLRCKTHFLEHLQPCIV